MSSLDRVSGEPSIVTRKNVSEASSYVAQHWRLSLLVLAGFCLAFAAAAAIARFTPVIDNYVAREVAFQRLTDGIFLYDDGYIDDGDYVLIGQLQQDDHAGGGVYFIGSSLTRTAIMPWLLPPDQERLVHNYAIGDVRHREIRSFIRSLVEEHGLLRAGGERVTVILELSIALAAWKDYEEEQSYARQLFTRHGFYSYDAQAGIHRVPMSSAERFIRLQRMHIYRFARILSGPPSRVKPFTPAQQTIQMYRPGPHWRETLETETADLAATVDYLQARGARVQAVFRPSPSWMELPPYEAQYRDVVTRMLTARGVAITDQSDLLEDYEIGDDWHATASGQMRVHEVDRALALAALERMGLMSQAD